MGKRNDYKGEVLFRDNVPEPSYPFNGLDWKMLDRYTADISFLNELLGNTENLIKGCNDKLDEHDEKVSALITNNKKLEEFLKVHTVTLQIALAGYRP